MLNNFLKISNKRNKKKLIYKIEKILKKSDASSQEKFMVKSILKLGNMTARDVMIPRIDVMALNSNFKKSEYEALLADKNIYSRIPIYEGNNDNIKGILHIKDLFRSFIKKQKKINILKIISDPYFVPESKKIISILKEFQSQHIHLAIVVDEYGGFAGILTMEDIIEEIIGDIQDEFDSEDAEIKKLDDISYSIDARINLETLNKDLLVKLPTKEAETLGGYLIMKVGFIPKLNQKIKVDGYDFKIIKKRRNSLIRIRMKLDPLQESLS